MEKTEKIKGEKTKQKMNYGAMEKCRAVLSVWTEKRKPAEICRELSIPWMILSQWQNRAMDGDAAGAGAEGESGQRAGAVSPPAGDAGKEAPNSYDEHSAEQAGKDTIKSAGSKEIGDTSVEARRPCPAEN
jgi:transposase-like protein